MANTLKRFGILIDQKVNERMACRICLEEEGILISPCGCKGSTAFVHRECLETWINTSGKDFCEICLEDYETEEVIVSSCDFGKFVRSIWCSSHGKMRHLLQIMGIMVYFVLNLCLLIGFGNWIDIFSFMNITQILFLVTIHKQINFVNTTCYFRHCLCWSTVIAYVLYNHEDGKWALIFEAATCIAISIVFLLKLALTDCSIRTTVIAPLQYQNPVLQP